MFYIVEPCKNFCVFFLVRFCGIFLSFLYFAFSDRSVFVVEMASFTSIPDDQIPSIIVHPDHEIAKINDNIYGGFTEYELSFTS